MKFQIGDLFIYTSELNRQYGIVTGFGQKNIFNFDESGLRIKGKNTDYVKVYWIHSKGSRWKGEHDYHYLERTLSNPDFGWKHYPVKESGNEK